MREEVRPGDAAAIEALTRATGMFRPDEVAIAVELVEDGLQKGAGSDYHFAFVDGDGRIDGYVCFGRTPCTVGTWDLYWIAVQPDLQGRGLGKRLVEHVEREVERGGGLRIFVDTSGRPDYAPTRAFYEARGYRQVAHIEDFYAVGDPKVVYGKRLSGSRRPGA